MSGLFWIANLLELGRKIQKKMSILSPSTHQNEVKYYDNKC